MVTSYQRVILMLNVEKKNVVHGIWENVTIKWRINNRKKQELIEKFQEAKDYDMDLMVELTVPTREDTEIIIVKRGNLDYKLDYYKKNYNDNLQLERCADICILNAELINWKEE